MTENMQPKDWFAAFAMQALLVVYKGDVESKKLTDLSYEIASTMNVKKIISDHRRKNVQKQLEQQHLEKDND